MIDLMRSVPAHGRIVIALALAVLLALPLAADRYVLSVLTLIFYFAYVGQAWNLMMGYAGQLSLGHALYVGVGGYVAALLWLKLGIGLWITIVGVVVALVGGILDLMWVQSRARAHAHAFDAPTAA